MEGKKKGGVCLENMAIGIARKDDARWPFVVGQQRTVHQSHIMCLEILAGRYDCKEESKLTE